MPEPWCDYGDLPVATCEHCRSGKKNSRSPQDTAFRGPLGLDSLDSDRAVPATFRSMCNTCLKPIRKASEEDGHWVVKRNGHWIHEGCADD